MAPSVWYKVYCPVLAACNRQLRPYSTPVQPRKSMEWDPSNLGNSNTSLFPQHSAPVKWAITCALRVCHSKSPIQEEVYMCSLDWSVWPSPWEYSLQAKDDLVESLAKTQKVVIIFLLYVLFFPMASIIQNVRLSFVFFLFLHFKYLYRGMCGKDGWGEGNPLMHSKVGAGTYLLPLALQTNYKMAESIQEITNLTSTNVYWGLCIFQALRHKDDDVSWNADFMALKLFGILEIIQQINIVKKRKVTQLTKYKSISEILWILF